MIKTDKPYIKWEDVKKEYFTSEEIAESDLRVTIISRLISIREENSGVQETS